MSDETTDESNTTGKENNTISKESLTPVEQVRKDVAELKAENDAYDEQKLRAEVIRAERIRGGESSAGQEEKPEFTKEELAHQERVNKIGRATGAQWAKPKVD